jgi:hypothetical protein
MGKILSATGQSAAGSPRSTPHVDGNVHLMLRSHRAMSLTAER